MSCDALQRIWSVNIPEDLDRSDGLVILTRQGVAR